MSNRAPRGESELWVLLAVIAFSILMFGCTEPAAAPVQPTANQVSPEEQGLTEEQIAAIVAENQRVLGAMPDTDGDTEWVVIATIENASDEADYEFTADSTWRLRWIAGGCGVRTTPIDAYNGWYTLAGLSVSSPVTKPNKNPGTHSVNVVGTCTFVVEKAVK